MFPTNHYSQEEMTNILSRLGARDDVEGKSCSRADLTVEESCSGDDSTAKQSSSSSCVDVWQSLAREAEGDTTIELQHAVRIFGRNQSCLLVAQMHNASFVRQCMNNRLWLPEEF